MKDVYKSLVVSCPGPRGTEPNPWQSSYSVAYISDLYIESFFILISSYCFLAHSLASYYALYLTPAGCQSLDQKSEISEIHQH